MENEKLGQVGALVVLAIALIVGAILLQASAQNVGQVTNTVSVVNESMGVASNSTTVYYTNYRALNDVVIVNNSNGVVVPATNYTVSNNIVYNGQLASSIQPNSAAAAGFTGYIWNVTYTGEPTTYTDNAGRSMSTLIIVMMALALIAVALVPVVKGYME